MNPLVFIPTSRVMITHRFYYFHVSTLHSELFMFLTRLEPKIFLSNLCCILVTVVMDPIVRIDPNGCQALLSHDDAIEDLKNHGWDIFLNKFEGYNLQVEESFTRTFDGFRANIGDIQLELTKDFVRKATGLPSKGERWFKNKRIEEVPRNLFMTS
jgi:hypothetical protein